MREPGHKPSAWLRPGAVLRPVRNMLGLLVPNEPPLELQIVGRTLLHAALVGLLAGVVGSAFLTALEWVQGIVLEDATGYAPLRAAGEAASNVGPDTPFRWWLLLFIPAIGGAISGAISRYAPETRGGGGDAAIQAFHHDGGKIRRRVLWAKPLAAIATLGTGGSGGREGPTMQIGAAIGSIVGRYLALTARERRTLMVAGIGAGISAVFRTPLGAALLAIEVLYRDDFESEALIPCVLASVIAYSVALSVFGTEPLFGQLKHFPFHPGQLPLFFGLALVVSMGATAFEHTMAYAKRLFARLPGPEWLRPSAGGLVLGVFVVILLLVADPLVENGHHGLGVLGGGYGAGQLAIKPEDAGAFGQFWQDSSWAKVELLLALAVAKIIGTSATIGSGGVAGDFAPSIAIGGLLGGAYGTAASLILHDPSIEPGAYALVGMAAFYAGIANTPLAALVMVSEVCGSYDLLVPLMLTEGIAMIALRKVNLYRSQPKATKDSPVHASPLATLRCGDVVPRARPWTTLAVRDKLATAAEAIEAAVDQDVFPVVDDGKVVGLLSAEALRGVFSEDGEVAAAIVADVMVAALTFRETDEVRAAAIELVRHDLRAAPVVDATGGVLGMLDQNDIVQAITVAPAPGDTGS